MFLYDGVKRKQTGTSTRRRIYTNQFNAYFIAEYNKTKQNGLTLNVVYNILFFNLYKIIQLRI